MVHVQDVSFKLENTPAKISCNGGLVLVNKMAEVLGVSPSIDEKLGHLKRRNRGFFSRSFAKATSLPPRTLRVS